MCERSILLHKYIKCPIGTYSSDKSCLICHATCETCSNGKSTDCIFCKEGYYMNN